MAIHLEFVVLGSPVSNQQSRQQGRAALATWRARVAREAEKQWTIPLLMGQLKVILINFHTDDTPSVDVDNMSKPILDALQQVIYDDDRQIIQAEITHTRLDALYSIGGSAKIIANALQANQPFVYVRIEDPVVPFPLPKEIP
jgi:Holliday junction resolvase RusA-like endonuclease